MVCLKDLINYNKYRLYCFRNGIEYKKNEEYERILSARYMKVSRIKKRIIYLFTRYKYNYFCTFTFDDINIKKSDRTKRDMIKHALLDFDENIKIILNIDFGKKTEREHYHAIVSTNCMCNLDTFLHFRYNNFCSAEKIIINGLSIKKVSKYINKLSNHATKESTRRSRLYYNFKGYDELRYNENRHFLFFLDKQKLAVLDKANITGKNS